MKHLRCHQVNQLKRLAVHSKVLGPCHMLQCRWTTGGLHSVKETSVDRDWFESGTRASVVFPKVICFWLQVMNTASPLTHILAASVILAEPQWLLEETLSNSAIAREVIWVHLRSLYQTQCAPEWWWYKEGWRDHVRRGQWLCLWSLSTVWYANTWELEENPRNGVFSTAAPWGELVWALYSLLPIT